MIEIIISKVMSLAWVLICSARLLSPLALHLLSLLRPKIFVMPDGVSNSMNIQIIL
jgi:hypothetical protein